MDKIELPTHISGDWWPGIGPVTVKRNSLPMDLTDASIIMLFRALTPSNQ